MDRVVLASMEASRSADFQNKVWITMRRSGYSRRELLDRVISEIYVYPGVILQPDGMSRWDIPDLDDVMGDPRWISYYLETRNGKQRRRTRKIERIRIFDVWCQIHGLYGTS